MGGKGKGGHGKGGQAKANGGQILEALQARFVALSNKFYEQAMDLNVPQMQVASASSELLILRGKLLEMYGVPTGHTTQWAPTVAPVMALGDVGDAPAADETLWKSKLLDATARLTRKAHTREDIVFSTTQDETKGYVSVLSSPTGVLRMQYTSDTFHSKKAAEHSAAKAALQAEFPEVVSQLEQRAAAPAAGGKGQKRKGMEPGPALEGKGQLSLYVTLLLGRNVLKEDIVYETVQLPGEDEGGGFACTVSLPLCSTGRMLTGAGATKKLAEMAAANLAVQELESLVAPLLEEQKAKKAQKNKEMLEKLKDKEKERKALAKAANLALE